jgi:hypothetical protein
MLSPLDPYPGNKKAATPDLGDRAIDKRSSRLRRP